MRHFWGFAILSPGRKWMLIHKCNRICKISLLTRSADNQHFQNLTRPTAKQTTFIWRFSLNWKSAIINPVHYSKQITKGCISYQKISLPPEAMLQEPYLRGKNQGSTYWDRRHSIPRYWNIWMLDNITTQPYLTKGQEPLELLMVFNPDPSQLSLKFLKETSLFRIYHKTFQKICII